MTPIEANLIEYVFKTTVRRSYIVHYTNNEIKTVVYQFLFFFSFTRTLLSAAIGRVALMTEIRSPIFSVLARPFRTTADSLIQKMRRRGEMFCQREEVGLAIFESLQFTINTIFQPSREYSTLIEQT